MNAEKKTKLYEVLKNASSKRAKAKRIEVLQENESVGLRYALQAAFDDMVKINLPEGPPPYVPSENPKQTIDEAILDLPRFCLTASPKSTSTIIREVAFTKLLQSIPKQEAELMIAIKDKKLQSVFKGITKEVVKEAFPRLIAK